jgi:hypothetical protein
MPNPTIQYAHAGRWHVLGGSRVEPEEYDAYVAHANERDGWPRWRVADASRDRESGAPLEPVREPTPFTEDELRDFMPLVFAKEEGTIDAAGEFRLREILDAHRFERLTDEARALISTLSPANSKGS